MKPDTVSALLDLNRRFYDAHAADFDATRGRPWEGWGRILERLPPPGERPLAVLDLGCGNGRFATYLQQSWPGPVDYAGLDGCDTLLAAAGRRCRDLDAVSLQRFELISERPGEVLGGRRFDLIAVFGVLHHVPGQIHRQQLLTDLARHLTARGLLAASIWQLDREPGFGRKTVSWKRYNQGRRQPRHGSPPAARIDLDELEEGDHLLGWRGSDDPPRYCHFPGSAEIESWIAASGLRRVERFESDGPRGDGNLYLILGR